MTIKEARKNAGLTQLEMSTVLNIPKGRLKTGKVALTSLPNGLKNS